MQMDAVTLYLLSVKRVFNRNLILINKRMKHHELLFQSLGLYFEYFNLYTELSKIKSM